MNVLDDLVDFLNSLSKLSFRKRGSADHLLLAFESFCNKYKQLTDEERIKIINFINRDVCMKLIFLSSTAASHAIDTNQPAWIYIALLGHIIEGFRIDYRENIRRLIFISYACDQMQVDFNKICQSLLIYADETTKKHLIDYMNRPAEINALSVFGMKAIKINDRTRFVPLEFKEK